MTTSCASCTRFRTSDDRARVRRVVGGVLPAAKVNDVACWMADDGAATDNPDDLCPDCLVRALADTA